MEYNDNTHSYICDGEWIMVDQYGNYLWLRDTTAHATANVQPILSYLGNDDCSNCTNPPCGTVCKYTYDNNMWKWKNNSTECTEVSNSADTNSYIPVPTDNEFMIKY